MSENETKAKLQNLLQQFVGDWVMEVQCTMPDGSTLSMTGEESVEMLGDNWMIASSETPMPDTDARASNIMTVGYDDTRKSITGTFVSSCQTHLWIYESGELSADGKSVVLSATGPAFESDGGLAKYKDTLALREGGRRSLSSQVQTDDGSWVPFMEAIFRLKD